MGNYEQAGKACLVTASFQRLILLMLSGRKTFRKLCMYQKMCAIVSAYITNQCQGETEESKVSEQNRFDWYILNRPSNGWKGFCCICMLLTRTLTKMLIIFNKGWIRPG